MKSIITVITLTATLVASSFVAAQAEPKFRPLPTEMKVLPDHDHAAGAPKPNRDMRRTKPKLDREPTDGHPAGDEHEIEFDIAAGV